ncbi:MAG TPA: DUF2490 domain-containing protein [Puia sp.]|jgi:hypothetical protein
MEGLIHIKHYHFTIIIILGVCLSNEVKAQTVDHFSGWSAVFSTTRLNSKFSLHLEAQVRSNNEWKEVQTVILRTGLNYNIKPGQIITVGYAYIAHHRTRDSVRGWGPEQRIWEQFILNKAFSINDHLITIQNRFRLEQRWISRSTVKDDQLVTDGYIFSQRIRYFARAIYPFSPTSQKVFSKGSYFSLQDELFFNLGNTSDVNGKFFDQNRAYTSIGYRFSSKYDLEIGYMNQIVSGRDNLKTINNILQFAAYLRL